MKITVKKYTLPPTLTISRSQWIRGTPAPVLFRPIDGARDIVGFICKAAGVPDELLESQSEPTRLYCTYLDMDAEDDSNDERVLTVVQEINQYDKDGEEEWLVETDFSDTLMCINDDRDITDLMRESRIRTLCKGHGVKVSFQK